MLLFVDPINDAPRRYPASAAATNNSYAGSPQPPRKLNQALGQPNSPSPEQLHKWHARFRKEAFALDVNISRMNWVVREKILPTIFVDGEPLYTHSLLSDPRGLDRRTRRADAFQLSTRVPFQADFDVAR